jgi:hypothetical protein
MQRKKKSPLFIEEVRVFAVWVIYVTYHLVFSRHNVSNFRHTVYRNLQPVAAKRSAYSFAMSIRCLYVLIVLCLNNFASGIGQETMNAFRNKVPVSELRIGNTFFLNKILSLLFDIFAMRVRARCLAVQVLRRTHSSLRLRNGWDSSTGVTNAAQGSRF